MKIAIFASAIFRVKGGVERVASSLANFLSEKKHTVFLLYREKVLESPVYALKKNIRTFEIIFSNEALSEMRNFFIDHDFDVVCVMSSTNERAFFVSIMNGLSVPLIFSEHGHPDYIEKYLSNHALRQFYFSCADALHFLSPRYCEDLSKENLKKVFVIPNFSDLDDVSSLNTKRLNEKIILSVAKLCEFPKRISLLIKAFSLVSERFPEWKCIVCGSGVDEERYRNLIQALGLETKILLVGEVENISLYYSKASIFCLPSEVEGFPCVLVEAQHYGIPSVGFAACSGVNEIIIHGENGFLASDVTPASLANCLETMMSDSKLLHSMSKNSFELSKRYDSARLLDEWCKKLESVSTLKGKIVHDFEELVDYAHIRNTMAAGFKIRRESYLLDREIINLSLKA